MAQLPLFSPSPVLGDWLLNQVPSKAGIYRLDKPDRLVLSNGLIARTFLLKTGTTIGLENLMTGESLLRAVRPEAIVVTGEREVSIGGMSGQPDLAYLRPDWIEAMKPIDGSLTFTGYEVGRPVASAPWKRVRHSSETAWPPKGVALTLHFASAELKVDVHYEIYDGIPLISKWIEIENPVTIGDLQSAIPNSQSSMVNRQSPKPLRIKKFTSEILSMVEAESVVDPAESWRRPPISVFTDYSFGGSTKCVYWEIEPEYKTQVNYELKTPCRLELRPPLGPDVDIPPGGNLKGFRAYEVFHDSYDRERQGLAIRRLFRTVAPWTQENPIMLHLTSTDPAVVHRAIDQAAECGFEMVVISFWSGLDMENVTPENIKKFKDFREYANSKGVELGGYSLLASRSIDKKNDIVSPKPIFGASPCLGSEWGKGYFEKLKKFITETGFNLLEHDGSYPGDTCASTKHPGHHGYEDSHWTQFQAIADFYRWCKDRGVFLNVPDVYFLSGSNKTGMGYRESNWSLPRDQQHIHARQNLFDGTWEKTPSMGWMMVPLVEYQGGGPAATIEPLKDHLPDYALHLANNFGYGAQACYRGPRLYDTPETRAVVQKWVKWFKAHREILESDVVHVRRADGQNLDAVLHVNPALKTKAMAVVYNPGDRELEQEIVLSLYYSGLKGTCTISHEDARGKAMKLDEKGRLLLKVKVAPKTCTWFTFSPPT
jgi:hypothetical protein